MTLDNEQQLAAYAPEHRVLVLARAGSGKTTTLTARVQHLIETLPITEQIVAITFTNLAAEEMKSRLADIPPNLFVGTIHSYANHLLISHGIKTYGIIQEEQFDKLFDLVKSYPFVINPVTHLLIDEFQDTSEQQLEFIDMINPTYLFAIGDDAQSIFSFNGSDVTRFRATAFDDNWTIYRLKTNYRSGYEIVNFAQKFLTADRYCLPNQVNCLPTNKGQVFTSELEFQDAVNFFLKVEDPGNWFILCRTNAEVDNFCTAFKRHSIPYATFKKRGLGKKDLEDILGSDKIKVLTVHTAKGLESPKVWVEHFHPRESIDETARLKYVAATRAREVLVWNYHPRRVKAKSRAASIKTTNWS